MSKLYPVGLAVAGAVVAVFLVLPFRAVPFDRGDGTRVWIPDPTMLNHTSDTWDYLQQGREIHRGNGFSSLFTYVPHLPDTPGLQPELRPDRLRSEEGRCFPVVWRQPLFPVMIAAAFLIAGWPDPNALLFVQGLAVILLPLATYLLARRFLTSGWAAFAALWTLMVPLVLGPRSPLVATTWFTVVFALVVGALCIAKRPRGWVVGLLLGLAALLRLDILILLPGLLVMVWFSRDSGRVRFTAETLLVMGLICVPMIVRQISIIGDGFYNATSLIYHKTDTFPEWTSSRTLAVRDLTAWGFFLAHPGEVLAKTGINLLRYLRDLILLPSPLLAPVLWFAVLRTWDDRRRRAFLLGGVVTVITLLVVLSPMEYSARFLAPLVPLMAVGATLGLVSLPRFRGLLATGATVVGFVMIVASLTNRPPSGTAASAAGDLRTLVAANPDIPAGPVLSDAPTIYAWIWDDCGAIWMPVASDVHGVQDALNWRAVALFTRAGGSAGDGLEADLVDQYVARGGIASDSEKPLTVAFPVPE